MSEITPTWQQPSHPDRLEVVQGDGPSGPKARSLISLPAGALFARITSATPVPRNTSTSVGNGRDSRVELNSDLVYCKHSCDPSLIFDMSKMEVRVSEHRALEPGDDLTFFYPSTEWRVAQPFWCKCTAGEDQCVGWIGGSCDMEYPVLARYWLNYHIRDHLGKKIFENSMIKQIMREQANGGN